MHIQKGELPGKVRSGHEKSHRKFICRLAVAIEIRNTSRTLSPLTMPVASLRKVTLLANFHPSRTGPAVAAAHVQAQTKSCDGEHIAKLIFNSSNAVRFRTRPVASLVKIGLWTIATAHLNLTNSGHICHIYHLGLVVRPAALSI